MSRIAVIGPGAVGLTYAAALRADHEVVLCARRPLGPVRVEWHDDEPTLLDLPVITDPTELGDEPWDWVLVAVKAHQVPGAAGWLAGLQGSETTFAVLQNGVEQRESVAPFLPDAKVVPTIVWSGSELVEPDRLVVKGDLRLVVPDDHGGAGLAMLFRSTPVTVDLAADFAVSAWHKLLANAVAGLEVLALRRAEMFHLDDVYALALALAQEGAAVARSTGAAITDEHVHQVVELYRTIPTDMGTSMLYDRMDDRPLEWDARNGVLCRLGRQHGVPTPVSDVLVPLLRAASPDSYPASPVSR